MEVEFFREIHTCYMKINGEFYSNDFQMKMVVNNTIEHLLSVMVRQINDEIFLNYKITGMISLSEYYEKTQMTGKDIKKLIHTIEVLYENLDRYLLVMDAIVLDPDMIFFDLNKQEWYFCYYSQNKDEYQSGMKKLFEKIVQIIDHGDAEAVTYAYGIYKRICMGIIEINNLFEVNENQEKDRYEIVEDSYVRSTVIPEVVEEENQEIDKNIIYVIAVLLGIALITFVYFLVGSIFQKILPRGINGIISVGIGIILGGIIFIGAKKLYDKKDLFGKKIYDHQIPYEEEKVKIKVPSKEEDSNLTMVLNEETKITQHELRWNHQGNKDSYKVIEDTFIIGSSKEKADCVIELPGISRMHARISKEGDAYYIKDLNSTNGTRVDSRELVSFELVEIKMGDEILLGNVKCTFV